MPLVDLLGWTATAVGAVLGAPQLIRLIRTRSVDGLSLGAWQAVLTIGIIWLAHGIRIGQAPQVTVTVVGLFSTIPILVLMARQLGRAVLATMLPGVLGGLAGMAVDQWLGSVWFGVAAIVAAAIASIGQSVQLVRAPNIAGVSAAFIWLAFINQALWLTWSSQIGDAGSLINACANVVLSGFNLVWYLLRRAGLRPMLARVAADPAAPIRPAVPRSARRPAH